MSMQAGLGLSKVEIVDYIRSVFPVVIQLSRHGGRRGPSEIDHQTTGDQDLSNTRIRIRYLMELRWLF
jgi:hypothetical protein